MIPRSDDCGDSPRFVNYTMNCFFIFKCYFILKGFFSIIQKPLKISGVSINFNIGKSDSFSSFFYNQLNEILFSFLKGIIELMKKDYSFLYSQFFPGRSE